MVSEMTFEANISVFSIGHSTHTYERFLSLLRGAGITAIADVRTSPYSRHFPQFNKDPLKDELRMDSIAYSFLGKELGGRPKGSQYYCDGVADYERMATATEFQHGIQRVIKGAHKYRIALMCSEHDPLDCHRCLLVGRALSELGVKINHILSDGSIVSQSGIEERLLRMSGRESSDLFAPRKERLAAAYRERGRKVAFAEPSSAERPVAAE
jgi:uncharacterized protein (DUF488 family)